MAVLIEDVTVTSETYATSLAVAVGATDADSQIVIAAMSTGGGITHSIASDFTTQLTIDNGGIFLTLFTWDGSGTRPNSSNVTVTSDALEVMSGVSVVLSGASGYGNNVVSSQSPDSTSSSGTITATADSLLLHFISHLESVTITITAPTPVPSVSPTLPADEGIFPADGGSQTYSTILSDVAASGTTDAATSTHSYANVEYGTLEVLIAAAGGGTILPFMMRQLN